jgi:hypothetical protein
MPGFPGRRIQPDLDEAGQAIGALGQEIDAWFSPDLADGHLSERVHVKRRMPGRAHGKGLPPRQVMRRLAMQRLGSAVDCGRYIPVFA